MSVPFPKGLLWKKGKSKQRLTVVSFCWGCVQNERANLPLWGCRNKCDCRFTKSNMWKCLVKMQLNSCLKCLSNACLLMEEFKFVSENYTSGVFVNASNKVIQGTQNGLEFLTP